MAEKWLKGCEICDAGLCSRILDLVGQGMSQRKAVKVLLEDQVAQLGEVIYSANALRSRFLRLVPPGSKRTTPTETAAPSPVVGVAAEPVVVEPPAAPNATVTEKPKNKPVFNEPTREGIEWARWSWNPISGCLHGCQYCYARDIANRFFDPKIGFKPHFYPHRLSAPQNMPHPDPDAPLGERCVVTVSMGDMFGDWVPQEWIDAVLDAVQAAPQWNFLFLTKNPERYCEITFPRNAWVGATADTQERADRALDAFSAKRTRPKVFFLSLEPLREKIILGHGFENIDWVIIGGQSSSTGEPARQPEWNWVESILVQAREIDLPVYFKPNLLVRPREYPDV